MTVQCIACADFAFQRGPNREPTRVAVQGGGVCKHRPEIGVTVSALFNRECAKFVANNDAKVARLRTWLASPKTEEAEDE